MDGDDVFIVGTGFDKMYGGGGMDTALFAGNIEDYAGLDFGGSDVHVVDHPDSGRDRLKAIETFEFRNAIMNAVTGEVTFKSDEPGPETGLVVTTLDDSVAADGEFSLREAILTANGRAGEDTITFDGSLKGGTIMLDQGLGQLDVTDDVVIDGDTADGGAGGITIDGNNAVLHLLRADQADLAIEDATLTRGGIDADGASYTRFGGGVAAYGAEVNITRASFVQNYAVFGGGGVHLDSASIGTVTNSLFRANAAGTSYSGSGGAIDSDGAGLVVQGSAFISNSAGDGGGGISATGLAEITASSFFDNDATEGRAAIQADRLSLVGSTLTGNVGLNSPGSIAVGGDSEVVNSTIVDNDQIDVNGLGTTLTITNSTIFGNAGYTAGRGIEGDGSVAVNNSIVLDGFVQTIASNGANVFGNGVTGTTGADVTGAEAGQLFADGGALADNGGPTQTIALLDDAANPALDNADPDDAPASDQRGQPRDGTPDIGAFELQDVESGGGGGGSSVAGIPYFPLAVISANRVFGDDSSESDLVGTDNADLIDPRGGDDQPVHGFDGDDVFVVGAGFDKMYGGGGMDTALFAGNIEEYAGLDLSGSNVHVVDHPDSGRDRLKEIETFEFKNAVMNAVTGEVTFKEDFAPVLDPDPDPDPEPVDGDLSDLFPAARLTGSDGPEDLRQSGGIDQTLDARGGDDTQHGLDGNDFLIIGPGDDKNFGGSGFDVAVFDGGIGGFAGVSGVRDAYQITDTDPGNGDLGLDRVKAVEILAFDDALFDTRTGQTESFADSDALAARLENLIVSGDTIA